MTRNRALFYESLDIIRGSTDRATVDGRYDLMMDICKREFGWASWAKELEEARKKRSALFEKEIALDAQRDAEKIAQRHATIFNMAVAFIAAQPGIVQSKLLPLVKGYSPDDVRFALPVAAKEGRLQREKYQSSFKLFLIEKPQTA